MDDKNSHAKELAALAKKDRVVLAEIADLMEKYAWEVDAWGNDGHLEMKKIKELASQGIKILADYI